MDPQKTSDGKPYGPIRYEEIVRERYIISKFINTSYNDVGQITPVERQFLINYIVEELKIQENKQKELMKANKKGK